MDHPDRQTVIDFIKANPTASSKQEIAKGLGVKGRERQTLRQVLKELETDGTLTRTGRRQWAVKETLPATGVIEFQRINTDGELIARAVGKQGAFGPELIYTGYSGRRSGKAPGVGDRGLAKTAARDGIWTASLMKLFEARDTEALVTGVFERTARGGRIKPSSRKEKREFLVVEADTNSAETGDLVRARPLPQKSYGLSRARIVDIIGNQEDPRAAALLAIAAHDIPTDFPVSVLEQASQIKPAKIKREDLSSVPLVTIDPADAGDHDDAIYAEPLKDGWRVIVAIADVAAYVQSASLLDKEAKKRGNSTYFPDRVIPMLPFELSAGECSLKEGVDRYCLAVEMEFDKSGSKRKHRFIRGIMRSAGGISYAQAQTAIDGSPCEKTKPLLEPVLKPLWGAYEALKTAREKRGPLELELPERQVAIDDDGNVAGVFVKDRYDAHKLVEEMMIQANVAAAEELEKRGSKLLYRIHDAPSDAKIAALADFLKTLDIKWPLGEVVKTHRFNRLLADFSETDEAEAVSEIVLRSQSQAIYSAENIGNFGLNLTKYAHFTSPIRRYSDLIVHRALITANRLGSDGLNDRDAASLQDLASHLVQTERRSMAAEREATDRYLAGFLSDQLGVDFAGRISGVTRAGLFVRLSETGADGFVPASRISRDYWYYDDGAQALIAEQSGRRYEMGQEVIVRLKEVTPIDGGILLELVSKPKPALAGHKPKPRSASGKGAFRRSNTRQKGRRKS